MTASTTLPETNGWDGPRFEPSLSPELLARWKSGRERAVTIAKRDGLTKAELARRADIPAGTLTPLLDGNYTGNWENQIAKLERWLSAVAEVAERVIELPEAPLFIETPTSRELVDTFLYAQQMPLMALVTLGPGMGKTVTAEHFRNRPGVHLVTMRPTTARVRPMLQEIGMALDVGERNPARLDRAIGAKLKRNGHKTLLLVDEAQNLSDEAVNQLRWFLDVYRCGIVLLGNEEVYSRYGRSDPREGYGQIHRRIGKRLRRLSPLPADIEAIVDAWGVQDEEARKLLRAIGRKPGALGQISVTMQLALMLAAGDGKPLNVAHVRQAWQNRGGDEVRA